MKPLLQFIFLLPAFFFGQTVGLKVDGGKRDIYKDAITHYIDSLHKINKLNSDTLFILSNDDFPESKALSIEGLIENIQIVFQDTAKMANRLKSRKSLNALNIFADQNSEKEKISIIIISFLVTKEQGKTIYVPLKNCRIKYNYSQSKKEFVYDKIVCDR